MTAPLTMKIPEIRRCLHALAAQMQAQGLGQEAAILHFLADQTRRRPAVRRAPTQRSTKLDPLLVNGFFLMNPKADYTAAAAYFNSNIGRVSEALRGFRS